MAFVGGGGLLQPVFEKFWDDILLTNIPVVAFGIGINTLPPHRPLVASRILKLLSERAAAIHVRDQFTLDAFERIGCRNVTIGPCPSISLLNAMRPNFRRSNKVLLHVVHPVDLEFSGVCLDDLRRKVKAISADLGLAYVEINHLSGFNETILDVYASAAVVVTSRLHGCIFSYAMEKPFIAIECDTKTRAFVSSHTANGSVISASELKHCLSSSFVSDVMKTGPVAVNLDALRRNETRMLEVLESMRIN
jgi:polysaccharide pyruvyl transferase WcaK-like protein